MSTKSGPLKNKGETLFEKAKDAIGDLWNKTTDKAEDLKEIAQEKIEELKDKVADNKAPTAKKVTAVKPLATGKSILNKTADAGKVKSETGLSKSATPANSTVKKAVGKKAVSKKNTHVTTTTQKKVAIAK